MRRAPSSGRWPRRRRSASAPPRLRLLRASPDRAGRLRAQRLQLVEELVVVGVARKPLDQRFHRFHRLHRKKHLSKLLHLLVLLRGEELLLLAGTRLRDVDRRENALL